MIRPQRKAGCGLWILCLLPIIALYLAALWRKTSDVGCDITTKTGAEQYETVHHIGIHM